MHNHYIIMAHMNYTFHSGDMMASMAGNTEHSYRPGMGRVDISRGTGSAGVGAGANVPRAFPSSGLPLPAAHIVGDKIPADTYERALPYRDPLRGNWEETVLSRAFFCDRNVEILQNGIRAGVYSLSNGQYTVGKQDEDQLRTIMRSVFIQNAKHIGVDIAGGGGIGGSSDEDAKEKIRGQIEQLNRLVLDYAVRQVYGEAEGYMKYKHDVSNMYEPISHPIMSRPNDKQLEYKRWFK